MREAAAAEEALAQMELLALAVMVEWDMYHRYRVPRHIMLEEEEEELMRPVVSAQVVGSEAGALQQRAVPTQHQEPSILAAAAAARVEYREFVDKALEVVVQVS